MIALHLDVLHRMYDVWDSWSKQTFAQHVWLDVMGQTESVYTIVAETGKGAIASIKAICRCVIVCKKNGPFARSNRVVSRICLCSSTPSPRSSSAAALPMVRSSNAVHGAASLHAAILNGSRGFDFPAFLQSFCDRPW